MTHPTGFCSHSLIYHRHCGQANPHIHLKDHLSWVGFSICTCYLLVQVLTHLSDLATPEAKKYKNIYKCVLPSKYW